MKLKCLTAPAGQSETLSGSHMQSTGYYGAIPFTLVYPYSQTIQLGQAAQFQGCEVQQFGLNTQTTATYRSLATTVGRLAGTAITFGASGDGTGDNAEVRDTTIIGFNTGIYSNKNSNIKITNVMDDSTRCADIQNESLGVATITDFYCYPLLTRNIMAAQSSFFLTNIADNTHGVYRATLCPTGIPGCSVCTSGMDCPMDGDTVWISNPQGAESTGGRWSLLNCSGTPLACDLVGSNSTLPNPTANGTFAAGATQISSMPSNSAMVTRTTGPTPYGNGAPDFLIRLTISGMVGTVPPTAGQIASVTGFTANDTPEANGVWQIQNVDTVNMPPQWIELHNSVIINKCGGGGSSQPNCPMAAEVKWGYPSVGQGVTAADGKIPSGTTVTRVWPAQDIVYLSNATTGPESTGTTLSYSDNTFGFGKTITSVFQCSAPNNYDICLRVFSTQDLVSGRSDIVVNGTGATGADVVWNNVILGNNGASPGTIIDLPCSTAGMMTNCLMGTCSGPCGIFYTGYMILDADQRQGDAVYLAGALSGSATSDVQIVNLQVFQHDCGLHFGTGTTQSRAVNVKVDQYDQLDDILFCGIKYDGTAQGNFAVNGEINAAGIDIVSNATQNAATTQTNTVENMRLGASQKTLAYQVIFEDDGKRDRLALAHNTSDATGYALVADSIPSLILTANDFPQVNLFFQSSGTAQAHTTGILNQFASSVPNMATMGDCSSTTSLATPMLTCGFIGVSTFSYPGGSVLHPVPMTAMFDNVTYSSSLNSFAAFADSADGSGKCHWVTANTPGMSSLTVSSAAGDLINNGSSATVTAGRMGIFCTYSVGHWAGGSLS
jgi:hypothetical protein